MTRFFSAHARRIGLWGLILAGLPAAAILGIPPDGSRPVLINESASLPQGLYLRRPDARPSAGAIVAVAQPVRARPYLESLGVPGEVRLIKRIEAGGGDRVCRTGDRLQLPRREIIVPAADRRGARLPHWAECRRLAADELFLLGDTAGSFDSRYFGPVTRASIDGVYVRILTW